MRVTPTKHMPTVYLIAQPTIPRRGKLPDLTPLYEHGEVQVLIQSGEYPTFNPEQCYEHIKARLADFDPETDFLVWAGGDTLAAVITGVVLADMGFGWFRWLRHERGRDPVDPKIRTDAGSNYQPVMVDISNIQPADAAQFDFFPNEGTRDQTSKEDRRSA